MKNNEISDYTIVPMEKISDSALSGLIDEFILREGTDYGRKEFSLAEKHEQLKKQLVNGSIIIVFDLDEETASIIKKEQLR